MQQTFPGSLKVPSVPHLLSIYKTLITNWEDMRNESAYSSIYGALDAGVTLLGKYYDQTDESALSVFGTGI